MIDLLVCTDTSGQCIQNPMKRRKISRTNKFIAVTSKSAEFVESLPEVDENYSYFMKLYDKIDFLDQDTLESVSATPNQVDTSFTTNTTSYTTSSSCSSSSFCFSPNENFLIDHSKVFDYEPGFTPKSHVSGSMTPQPEVLISPSLNLFFPETPETNFSVSSIKTNESMRKYDDINLAQRAPINYSHDSIRCRFEEEEEENTPVKLR